MGRKRVACSLIGPPVASDASVVGECPTTAGPPAVGDTAPLVVTACPQPAVRTTLITVTQCRAFNTSATL